MVALPTAVLPCLPLMTTLTASDAYSLETVMVIFLPCLTFLAESLSPSDFDDAAVQRSSPLCWRARPR